jgi:hypothetical protein
MVLLPEEGGAEAWEGSASLPFFRQLSGLRPSLPHDWLQVAMGWKRTAQMMFLSSWRDTEISVCTMTMQPSSCSYHVHVFSRQKCLWAKNETQMSKLFVQNRKSSKLLAFICVPLLWDKKLLQSCKADASENRAVQLNIIALTGQLTVTQLLRIRNLFLQVSPS